LFVSAISACEQTFLSHAPNSNLNAGYRLSCVGVHDSPINVIGLFRIGHGDVDVGGFGPLTDLDHLRLGFQGGVRIIDARIESAARSNTDRSWLLLIPDADPIAPLWQSVDAIGAPIICTVHFVVQVVQIVVPTVLWPAALVEFLYGDRLSNQRAALRINNSPGDHTATLDLEVDAFDFLAFRNIERAPEPQPIIIPNRNIAGRDRKDRIPSGGDAGEPESPILVSRDDGRIGRAGCYLPQLNGHAARRLPFQCDKARDRGRSRFRLSRLSEDRVAVIK